MTVKVPKHARTGCWAVFDGQMRFKVEKGEHLVIKESAYCVPFVRWKSDNEEKTWSTKLSKTLKWNK